MLARDSWEDDIGGPSVSGTGEAAGSGIPIFHTLHPKLVRTVKMHEGKPKYSGLGSPEGGLGGGADHSVSVTGTTVNHRPHIRSPTAETHQSQAPKGKMQVSPPPRNHYSCSSAGENPPSPQPRFSPGDFPPEQPSQHLLLSEILNRGQPCSQTPLRHRRQTSRETDSPVLGHT